VPLRPGALRNIGVGIKTLTPEQAEALGEKIGAMVAYVFRLRERMEPVGIVLTDRLPVGTAVALAATAGAAVAVALQHPRTFAALAKSFPGVNGNVPENSGFLAALPSAGR